MIMGMFVDSGATETGSSIIHKYIAECGLERHIRSKLYMPNRIRIKIMVTFLEKDKT